MGKPRRFDDAPYLHFVTFSCYHRRRLLDHDQPKRVLLGVLNAELERHEGRCVGYVIMPDHVHALLWFPQAGCLSPFMRLWKGRSSKTIKEQMRQHLGHYYGTFPLSDPFWQVRFHSFEIHSREKIIEKLNYMHLNPVRAGLADRAVAWRWSSARWYEEGRTVGVPIEWVE